MNKNSYVEMVDIPQVEIIRFPKRRGRMMKQFLPHDGTQYSQIGETGSVNQMAVAAEFHAQARKEVWENDARKMGGRNDPRPPRFPMDRGVDRKVMKAAVQVDKEGTERKDHSRARLITVK